MASVNAPALLVGTMMLVQALMQMEGTLAAQRRDCRKFNASCKLPVVCPDDCPKMKDNKASTVCKIDCLTCQATCKSNGCSKKGAVCNDPRFVGGDGAFFYFHGKADEDFCIVSDRDLHINGHFIGKSVPGRTRDFTWVQAVAILYGPDHHVSVGARPNVAFWDDALDQMDITYDGTPVILPWISGASWTSPDGQLTVVRTENANSVDVQVRGLLKVSANVTDVSQEESRVHNYGVVAGEDCFAHLDLHFSFYNLSPEVAGVLGQTYSHTYRSSFRPDVPMPTMGGYHKFKTSSLLSTDCPVVRFAPSRGNDNPNLAILPSSMSMTCTSSGEDGIVCRR